MTYLVKHLIESKPDPVTIRAEAPIAEALNLMVQHDFSQLPVVDSTGRPTGIVSYESILRGLRSFHTTLDTLHVRDVVITTATFAPDDDLFDLLAQLKQTGAILILGASGALVGIVTSFDTNEYFRNRAEHLMHIEDIETTIKEIVLLYYTNPDGTIDEDHLQKMIGKLTSGDRDRPRSFDDLTLGDYIYMLGAREAWAVYEPVFQIPRESLLKMLNDIRGIRNTLAHFRSELSIEQIDQLRYCSDWLSLHWETYQNANRPDRLRKMMEHSLVTSKETGPADTQDQQEAPEDQPGGLPRILTGVGITSAINNLSIAGVIQKEANEESRYEPLAMHLLGQPPETEQVTYTFDEIETILGWRLPPSARAHRAWWTNDIQDHPQSQAWLEAGWKRTELNMAEGQVTFARIQETEK